MMSNKTVMVVDDDQGLRESIGEVLEDNGYRALCVDGGKAALALLRSQQAKPDLVLLDLMMPGMTGWQFREEQLRDPALAAIPVVVLTASRDLRGIQANEVAYKPLKLAKLLEIVRRNVSSPARSEPAERPEVAPSAQNAIGSPVNSVLEGGGEMGARMRAFDWSSSPVGNVESWSQSLRSAMSICLGSRFPICIYWGPELAALYNDGWSTIPGTKHPGALGRPAREVWPEIWDTISGWFEHVIGTGESIYQEGQILAMHRHGYTEECYFDFTFSPIRGDSGRIEGVFNAVVETTFRYVNERRTRVLRDLAQATAPARTALEACLFAAKSLRDSVHDVPFCALYLTAEGEDDARLVSSAGLPEGSPATPGVVSLSRGESVWPLGEAMRAKGVTEVSGIGKRLGVSLPGGAWPEPADAALVAPLLASGKTGGFLVLGVNPRRAVDDDYRLFAERAASQVASAIATASDYAKEKERAEALAAIDHAKTTFFSNVSHEFRTPLTLMLGPMQDLLAGTQGALEDGQRREVEMLYRNGLRLQKLVNALLDFSRLEAGRVKALYEPTDLAAITRELASAFDSAITGAGLTFTSDLEPLGVDVYVDREMWEKIVLNLLSNALKFTFEGGIQIALGIEDGAAVLRVKDTGVGVPPEEVLSLFERFHRVEGARSRTHEGSGIGLALVSELTKLHGGSASVDSAAGVGSTFTVSIPLGTAHLPNDRIDASRSEPRKTLGAAPYVEEARRWGDGEADPWMPEDAFDQRPLSMLPSNGRVLLADDNADMRTYVRRHLERHWSVDVVENGEQVIASAIASPPDLILTDVMMPGMDGFELLRRLRSDDRTRAIPVIMLSARSGEEARVEGLQAGAEDYLSKPFSARELLARVKTHLDLAKLRSEQERQRKQLYGLLMQAPVAVMVTIGPEHVCELANSSYTQMVGGRALLGKTFRTAFPELPDDAPVFQMVEGVYRSGQAFSASEYLVTIDRSGNGVLEDTWFQFTSQALRSEDGAVLGTVTVAVDVSAQVLARRSVEESEARFRLLITQVQAGIAQTDLMGRFTFTNERFQEVVGRSSAELRQTRMQDITHPDDVLASMVQFRSLVDQGTPFVIEKRYLRPDGSIVWVQDSVSRIDDRDGRPHNIVAVAIDVTQRRYGELALKESEGRVRELLEREKSARNEAESLYEVAGSFAEAKLDLEAVVQRLTDHGTKLVGANFGAFFYNVVNESGESFVLYTLSGAPKEAFAKFGLPRNTPLFDATFSGKGVVRMDDVKSDPRYAQWGPHYGMPKGHLPVTSYLAVPVKSKQGEVIGGLFFGHPEKSRFTEQHERMVVAIAQQAAMAMDNARLYETTLKATAIQSRRGAESDFAAGVGAAFTKGGPLEEVLTRCCELTVELLGVACARVWIMNDATVLELRARAGEYTPIDGDHTRAALGQFEIARIAAARRPHLTNQLPTEEWIGDPDWARREGMTAFAGYPLVVSGRLIGVFAMFARHELAQETLHSLSAVADTIAIGIDRDYADRAREARVAEMERALRFSDMFVGILGHDLRNPLSAITTAANLLESRADSERISRPVSRIVLSADRMDRMISQLLDLTRIRLGRGLPLKRARVDLGKVARAVVDELEPVHKREIGVTTQGDLQGMWDADRLAQLLSNLLGNACQHGTPSEPVLLALDGSGTGDVRLMVSNRGVIPVDLLPFVFEPLRSGDRAERRAGSSGLGLGLYITQQVALAHGGQIDVESDAEHGTRFSACLPRDGENDTGQAFSERPNHGEER